MSEPTSDRKSEPAVQVVPGGAVKGSIRPPGSKSLTNRAMICAAFASGRSNLSGALRSEDTLVMINALESIGVQVDQDDDPTKLVVDATGRRRQSIAGEPIELFMANSGTSIRFLTAALAAAGGNYRLSGIDRMHDRPIGDLVNAISSVIDGSIEATSPGGCPPVEISSSGWSERELHVAGSVSSQYLSGLMMAAPIAATQIATTDRPPSEITIVVDGELVSRPYVEMTASVMRSFGAACRLEDAGDRLSVLIEPDSYVSTDYAIEPDASAASYFWAAAAISGGCVTVEGLSPDALQGDVGCCEVLSRMGCDVEYLPDEITVTGKRLHGVDVDMNAISDTVQTIAVVALFADGSTRIRGVGHNRFKETDRIGDLATELRKLGAAVDEHDDGMTIHPPSQVAGATLQTYDDHRMAMSLSLAGLNVAGVEILNPACTAKTYPEFFADLERLLGRPHRWIGA